MNLRQCYSLRLIQSSTGNMICNFSENYQDFFLKVKKGCCILNNVAARSPLTFLDTPAERHLTNFMCYNRTIFFAFSTQNRQHVFRAVHSRNAKRFLTALHLFYNSPIIVKRHGWVSEECFPPEALSDSDYYSLLYPADRHRIYPLLPVRNLHLQRHTQIRYHH